MVCDVVLFSAFNLHKPPLSIRLMKRVEGWNFTFTPAPPEVLPAEVFEEERTLKLNGTTIALKRYAPAHTDSNISVHFTDADSGSCAGKFIS